MRRSWKDFRVPRNFGSDSAPEKGSIPRPRNECSRRTAACPKSRRQESCTDRRGQEKARSRFFSASATRSTPPRSATTSSSLGHSSTSSFMNPFSSRVPPTSRDLQEPGHERCRLPLSFALYRAYTMRIGPGYFATKESVVRSVTPSTVACATRTRSNGSLLIGGRPSIATT